MDQRDQTDKKGTRDNPNHADLLPAQAKRTYKKRTTDRRRSRLLNDFEIQEKERKRISEVLHNELGQLLYVVRLKLSKLNLNELSEENKKLRKEIEVLINEAIETTRDISFQLMPLTLKEMGLPFAIEALCTKTASSELSVKTFINIPGRLDFTLESVIYRIVQEALNNIVKHSDASHAEVIVTRNKGIIEVTVKDNGIGFDLTSPAGQGGMGIHYIKNNAHAWNGICKIFSSRADGTTVYIKLKEK